MPPKAPSRLHAFIALLFIGIGAAPFVTGDFRERSMLWNSASLVLLMSGIFSFLLVWKAFSMTRPRR